VAGSSAGAIIAALVAAGYSSHDMYRLVNELDMEKLLDERKFLIPQPFSKWLFLYWRLGLYKGNVLENWIAETLANRGLVTFSDLPPQTLRVVASDLTNGRLIVLPDDLVHYGINPRTFPIAKAIRMSCSVPYFFEPVRLKNDHKKNIIVDGGVISNFPMWLFDQENVKRVRPILGIKLSNSTKNLPKKEIKNAIQLYSALFETMKNAHDARYISRKHEKDIIFIPVNEVLSIEFSLSDEKKQQLMEQGRARAKKFLATWSY
jgi:NTE family protein